MESDSLRSSGEFTVVDMWVEGKLRSISVSRAAIESFLRLPPGASAMSDEDRREFVRTHLAQIVAAAKTQLQSMDPDTDSIVIDAAEAPATTDAKPAADRRRGGDRRKDDRRKVTTPVPRERRSGGDRRKN
jgi:hypothetical protein